jgi:TPR repeat protein
MTLVSAAVAGPFEDGMAAYERGDYATALRLWRPLAQQGNAKAQFNLGKMYQLGNGVPQDYAEAVKWYRLAAEQGNAKAQVVLAIMYGGGHGVPQDYAEVVKWSRLAAEQGVAEAQFHLGFMYASGQGVPQDFVRAHMWSNLAASRFPASQLEMRDNAVKLRDPTAALMTPAQIAEAQKLAREWKPK